MFFSFFQILIFWVVRRVKELKMVENDKKFCLLHSIFEEPYVIWLSFMFVNISLKILIFWVHRGVKEQKMVQNDKTCLSCSISEEQHIKWLSFMVQISKMIVSPGVFFNVKIFIFQFVKGPKGQKNGPKCWKCLSVAPYISGTIYHMIFIYSTHVCIKG